MYDEMRRGVMNKLYSATYPWQNANTHSWADFGMFNSTNRIRWRSKRSSFMWEKRMPAMYKQKIQWEDYQAAAREGCDYNASMRTERAGRKINTSASHAKERSGHIAAVCERETLKTWIEFHAKELNAVEFLKIKECRNVPRSLESVCACCLEWLRSRTGKLQFNVREIHAR